VLTGIVSESIYLLRYIYLKLLSNAKHFCKKYILGIIGGNHMQTVIVKLISLRHLNGVRPFDILSFDIWAFGNLVLYQNILIIKFPKNSIAIKNIQNVVLRSYSNLKAKAMAIEPCFHG
jgi:hypothetical protein